MFSCTGKPNGTLVPGEYFSCLADIQQSGKNLTARANCYIDIPGGNNVFIPVGRTVNPEASIPADEKFCPPADAKYCGDGKPGSPPPGVTVAGGPRLFADINPTKQTVLTGVVDNGANTLYLEGCFWDEDVKSPLGNVYVKTTIDAHTGHGTVGIWISQTKVNCVGPDGNPQTADGTPPGAQNITGTISVVTQPPGGKANGSRDSDNDGCPDKRELGDTPGSGGLRDPSNHYDYMNATKDGQNRVDDILAVVAQYFIDDPVGNPDMKSQTDRTALLGGNAWNLGPPNGQQRVDDILASVKQYHHDC